MWKSVPDFDTYEASDDGYIRNRNTGKILKNSIHKDGTGVPCVSLVRLDNLGNRKTHIFETRFVIAATYLGVSIWARPKSKFEYIDGDKFNNSVNNIRIKDALDIEGEEWRPIEDFEDSYAVSNLGRVKRLAHVDKYVRKDTGEEVERYVADNIIKVDEKAEYYEVNLYVKGKSEWHRIHRMVANAFIANPNNLPQVNHIDGNKHNNRVENLEWCSAIDNVKHSIETKLRGSQVGVDRSVKRIKCIETGQVFETIRQASSVLNIPEVYLGERIKQHKSCHSLHFEIINKGEVNNE